MKSCKQCDEYDVCSRQNDLRRKKPRCPKAKTEKPITHYDLLISKTPEELAEFIVKIKYPYRGDGKDYEIALNWLKSPVEVDE